MFLEKLTSLTKKINFRSEPFCYAPFSSLYFTQNGNVIACCQNRMYLLGRYPENSIQEIWQGEKINSLRKNMRNQDLSHGCFNCDPLDKNNFKLNQQYDFLRKHSKYPRHFAFQLSNICNLVCKMCNHENSAIHPTVNPLKKAKNYYDHNFVVQIEKYLPNLHSTSFLGGEIFLIDTFYELCERIIIVNNKITNNILSNGTLYNERIERLLLKGNFHITLSIDSFNKENYERIRVNADFDKTMENAMHFSDYMKGKGDKLCINVCLLRDNIEEIPSIFEYCCRMDFNIFINNVIWPQNMSLMYMESRKLKSVIDFLTHHRDNIGWFNNSNNKLVYERIIEQVKEWWQGALTFERSGLYKINDSGTLKEKLETKLITFMDEKMSYFNKEEKISILDTLNRYIDILKTHLKNEDELINIFKNIYRLPPNEIITEFMVSSESTAIDRMLMFR